MSQEQVALGKLIDGDARRDAVHVAVLPATASEMLVPGQRVGLKVGAECTAWSGGVHVGIVDPFLPGPVSPGQRFYVFLFPGTVTSLRHEWTHPIVDAATAVEVRS